MKSSYTSSLRAGMRGQSMVEFLIVAPVLLFVILSIVQLTLLYRAKATLDYAALEAARSGAVHGAKMSAMRDGLARGLTPLLVTSRSPEKVLEASVKAKTYEVPLWTRIEVISPTKAAWEAHKERQYDGRFGLPNDNLAFRSDEVRQGVSVQDANILKVKVTYHYPLIVPFVGMVMKGGSDLIRAGFGDHRISYRADLVGGHDRIPIETYAIVRMQSPIMRPESGNLP